MIQPIAPIPVPVPGTPVRCTGTLLQPEQPFPCHGVLVQVFSSNTGFIYIGNANMVKATGVGVIAKLAVPTVNSLPSFSAALTLAPNAINLGGLYIDADVANEGALVSVLIA